MRLLVGLLVCWGLAACGQTDSAEQATASAAALSVPAVEGDTALPMSLPLAAEPPVDISAESGFVLGDNYANEPLAFHEVAPDTYLLLGDSGPVNARNHGFTANAGFVVTTTGVVVIDSLGSPRLGQRLLRTIQSVTPKKILAVIVTGLSSDRLLGAGQLWPERLFAPAGLLQPATQAELQQRADALASQFPEEVVSWRLPNAIEAITGVVRQAQKRSFGEHTFDIYPLGDQALLVHQVDDDIVWLGGLSSRAGLVAVAHADVEFHLGVLAWIKDSFTESDLIIPSRGVAEAAPFPMLDKTSRYLARLQTYVSSLLDNRRALDLHDLQLFQDWRADPLFASVHAANLSGLYAARRQLSAAQ